MNTFIDVQNIKDRIDAVQERVYQAAQRSGRKPDEVRMVLVTKTHPVETIRAAIDAGARRLGENYAEEAIPKIQACKDVLNLEWHMIGHVQSRKANLISQYFHYLHSLDSLKLASRLNRTAIENKTILPVLLECNSSGETSKFGWDVLHEDNWPDLLPEFIQVVDLPNLRIMGLMTMAPFLDDPQEARPFFVRLRRFKEFLSQKIPQASWDELSMGMSSDFEVAVEEGATWIRVGQAILGPRM